MLSVMRPGPVAATLSLIVFLAACSGGDSSDSYRDAARLAVQNAVLTLDDLPEAWAVSSLGEDSYTNIQLTGDCARLNGRGTGFPGEVASASSEAFTGPVGQEVVNTVVAFNDAEAAAAALSSAGSLLLECTEQMNEALKQAIEIAADDRNVGGLLSDINTSVEPDAGFPSFGDESLAHSLRADFSAFLVRFEVNGHIVAIRDGPVAAVLVYAALGDESEEEETIAATMANRLSAASQSIPN